MSEEVLDMFGNEIEEGDLVEVSTPNIFIVRRISPGEALAPTVMILETQLTLSVSPGLPVPYVVKVSRPSLGRPN